jgi:hypothetical protein
MAKNSSVGIDVTVQGERSFRASLSEINAALRVNNAELEAVKEAYKGNEDGIDGLTAKQDALNRSVNTQKERLGVLEDALEKTSEKYGDADTRTLRMRESLIKAQTQLQKTQRELDDTSDKLENSNKNTEKLSSTLGELADAAGVNLPPALQSMTTEIDSASKAGAVLVGVLAGIVTGLASATISTAENAKELKTLSQQTGLTVEQLQELEYTSAALGIEEDEVQDKMKDLTSAMRDARDGSEDMQNAFERLGVSVTERNGELRSAGDVFYEVIDALGGIKNATERDAVAMQIFGEEAQKLNPLIYAGQEALQQYAEEANNLGYVMDTETVDKFSELQTEMEKLSKQSEALKNSFAVALLPILTQLFQAISAIPTPVLQTLVVLAGVVATIVSVVKVIKELNDTAKSVKNFFSAFDTSALKTTAIVLGVVAALIALATIIAVIIGKKNELESSLNTVGDTIGSLTGTVNQVQSNYSSVPRYARGTSYHPGGMALVGEEGPELVALPAGSRVYSNAQTQGMTGGSVNTYYVTIDAKSVKEFDDIIRIANQKKSSIRQGFVKN